jgi:two-component system, sensor histidine kinase and response regulator
MKSTRQKNSRESEPDKIRTGCAIAKGQDSYRTGAKPLRRKTLLAMIDKWAPSKLLGQCIQRFQQSSPSAYNDAPIDFEKALNEFDGDRQFLEELIGLFLDNVREKLILIHDAIDAGDAETVRGEAHAIKGGASNLTAYTLSNIAHTMEHIGKSGVLDGVREVLERFVAEFNRLEEYVTQHIDRASAFPT